MFFFTFISHLYNIMIIFAQFFYYKHINIEIFEILLKIWILKSWKSWKMINFPINFFSKNLLSKFAKIKQPRYFARDDRNDNSVFWPQHSVFLYIHYIRICIRLRKSKESYLSSERLTVVLSLYFSEKLEFSLISLKKYFFYLKSSYK